MLCYAPNPRYDAYDPAKRDAKLRKKFEKLDPAQKSIFTALERNGNC